MVKPMEPILGGNLSTAACMLDGAPVTALWAHISGALFMGG